MSKSELTQRIIDAIRNIPEGKVSTYGSIARIAGNPRAARQVSRILHTFSRKEGLPWHRVINREGRISLRPMQGYEEQKECLQSEGIVFDQSDRVDLDRYLWRLDEL